MALTLSEVRAIVQRVCARPDVLEACRQHDIGYVIDALGKNKPKVTQGQIAAMTGIAQGRLSEYMNHKRTPEKTSTFLDFADGLGMPAAARQALGLAPAHSATGGRGLGLGLAVEAAESGPFDRAGRSPADIVGARLGEVQPLLSNLSRASAIPVLSALGEIHRGYVEADRLMGSICITGPISLQMPVVERACEVTRGADRLEMLRFACQFMEFGGWVFQDTGDLMCAMHWTDRAFDYALELGDQRVIPYTLMRKAMIATESGNPTQGLGIANSALGFRDALTPRLKAVVLRQRSYSHAALGEVLASARDSDEAIIEAVAGEKQGETDRAPYCTPVYAEMEAGASWVRLGHLKTALPILEKSRADWPDHTQVRDYALCVSRLAAAYAAVGELEQACTTTEEVVSLAQGLGSRRVVGQIDLLYRRLDRWRQDPAVAGMRGRLKVLVDPFRPEREAG